MISAKDIRAAIKVRVAAKPCVLPDGGECMVKLLSANELKEAELDAYVAISADCRKRGVELTSFVDVDASTLDLERRVQMLWRAFVQEMPNGAVGPVFVVDHIREHDSIYIQALFEIYLAHQDTMGAQDPIDDDALDAVVRGVVDDGSADRILGRVSPMGLRRIVRAMAGRLREFEATE
jgi:hypothetical protein